MKLVIQLLLWAVIGVLGYFLFTAIYGEVKFNEVKEKRYRTVISNMRDIRAGQLAHKTVTGTYAKNFESLVRFIDTAEFTITQRRDTTVLDEEKTRRFRVDSYKEIVVVDTLGTASVKDSLYKNSDRYKTMMNVPIEGVTEKFKMQAGEIEKNNTMYPVFEVRIKKEVILFDQPKDFLSKEKQVVSVDQINGDALIVGSMTAVKTNTNFPSSYGKLEE